MGNGRRRLGLLAALVVAAVIVLLWIRRGSHDSGERPSTRAAPAAGAFSPSPRVRPALQAPPEPADLTASDLGPAPAEEGPQERPLAEIVDEASERVRAAARACVRSANGPDGSKRALLRFTLMIADDSAYFDQVVLVDSELGDSALEACLLDKVTRTAWSVPGAPPTERQMQEVLRLEDFAPAVGVRAPPGGK